MVKHYWKYTGELKAFAIVCIILVFLLCNSCTKYSANSSTGTNNSGNTTAPTILPPNGGTGTGSGSSGSGGTNTSNPHTYVQGLHFSNHSNAYITFNDSVSLKRDGSYTTVFAGTGILKSKVGSGAASDLIYTTASYFFRPYAYYSYVIFTSPSSPIGETLLFNDLTTVVGGQAQIRFISIDPLTVSTPITFKLTNYLDNILVPNRTYLDNKLDSNKNSFRTVTPGVSNISFIYKDSTLLTFTQALESGKKYTVFAGALSYVASVKGTLPINYYQVARHN